MNALIDERPAGHAQTLCIDFDGTLHAYNSGWKGVNVCDDPPVPGALAFLREAMQHFTVCIYSARSSSPEGRLAMHDWLVDHWAKHFSVTEEEALEELMPLRWPITKPYAHLTIDDRAMQFCGVFPSVNTIRQFKPWNRT